MAATKASINDENIPGFPGSHSTVRLSPTNKSRLIKYYVESDLKTNNPHIDLIDKAVFKITRLNEYETHKKLIQSLPPGTVPKIYFHKSFKYDELTPELKKYQPPTKEPQTTANSDDNNNNNNNTLTYSITEMDFFPYSNLSDSFTDIFNDTNDTKKLYNILKQYFQLQIDIIDKAHIIPYDLHVSNMMYDKSTDKLYFIDYGLYESLELIARIETPNNQQFYFEPTVDKEALTIYQTYMNGNFNDERTTPQPTKVDYKNRPFKLLFSEIEHAMLFHYGYIAQEGTGTFPNLLSLIYGIDKFTTTLKSVLTDLHFSNYFIKVYLSAIVQHSYAFNVNHTAIDDWIGGPFGFTGSSHRLLSFMRIYPKQFKQLLFEKYDYGRKIKNTILKLSPDEFYKYELEQKGKKLPIIERQLLYMMYLKHDVLDSFMYMISYVKQNLVSYKTPIYRSESTDRFSDDDLQINKRISWVNLIPATIYKQYALSYLENARGSAIADMNTESPNFKNILYVFNNVKAAHLKRVYSSFTTYLFKYNAYNPSDKNRLNCFNTNCVICSQEVMIDPFATFKITSISNETTMLNNKSLSYVVVNLTYP